MINPNILNLEHINYLSSTPQIFSLVIQSCRNPKVSPPTNILFQIERILVFEVFKLIVCITLVLSILTFFTAEWFYSLTIGSNEQDPFYRRIRFQSSSSIQQKTILVVYDPIQTDHKHGQRCSRMNETPVGRSNPRIDQAMQNQFELDDHEHDLVGFDDV